MVFGLARPGLSAGASAFSFAVPFPFRRHEPPLAQAQSARQRPLAHLHVVVLRAGEVVQREDKLVRRHDAQVGLQAAGKRTLALVSPWAVTSLTSGRVVNQSTTAPTPPPPR